MRQPDRELVKHSRVWDPRRLGGYKHASHLLQLTHGQRDLLSVAAYRAHDLQWAVSAMGM